MWQQAYRAGDAFAQEQLLGLVCDRFDRIVSPFNTSTFATTSSSSSSSVQPPAEGQERARAAAKAKAHGRTGSSQAAAGGPGKERCEEGDSEDQDAQRKASNNAEDAFLALDKHQLMQLLTDQRLCTASEVHVFDAVMAWVTAGMHAGEARMSMLPALLRGTGADCYSGSRAPIRFDEMSLQELDAISHDPVACCSDGFGELVCLHREEKKKQSASNGDNAKANSAGPRECRRRPARRAASIRTASKQAYSMPAQQGDGSGARGTCWHWHYDERHSASK